MLPEPTMAAVTVPFDDTASSSGCAELVVSMLGGPGFLVELQAWSNPRPGRISGLVEFQTDGTESGEFGQEVVAGAGVDGAGAGAGQHDVALLQPHAEGGDLARQPGHRDHRVAEHRVAAALGDDLAVAGEHRVDGLDVDVGGGDALPAEHEA